LIFAVLTQRQKMELADRAQHVVLSSATFDVDGKLMVTLEGHLPSRKITKQFNQKVAKPHPTCLANVSSLSTMSSTLAILFSSGCIACPSIGLPYQT
jgi:hypothetical protein